MSDQVCGHCNKSKRFEEFHKCSSTRTGHLTVCISCRKVQQQKYRKTTKGKAKDKRYNDSVKRYESLYKYWENNPDKKVAQTRLSNAIRDGKLVNPNCCEVCCCREKVEGHHYSYDEDKQLDVIWLCKSCHEKEHELIRVGGYKKIKGLYLVG